MVAVDGSQRCSWVLVAANAQLGDLDEAQRWLAKFRVIAPGVTIANIEAGQPANDPPRISH
jgi:adenylate cyclase